MPKGLPPSLEHEWRSIWHCPQCTQCPQCPPGYCCHLLAGPNPAPVLSLAIAPRPGDPSVIPLSCALLPGTQGSMAPCMAPGRTPQGAPQASLLRAQGSQAPKLFTVSIRGTAGHHPALTCSLGCRFLPRRPPPSAQTPPRPAHPPPLPYCMPFASRPPARGLSIIRFVVVDAGTGSGPWLAAGLEQWLCWGWFLQGASSSASLQSYRAAEEAHPEIADFPLQCRPLGLARLRRFAESCSPCDRHAHTKPLPTAPPCPPWPSQHLRFPWDQQVPGPCWG